MRGRCGTWRVRVGVLIRTIPSDAEIADAHVIKRNLGEQLARYTKECRGGVLWASCENDYPEFAQTTFLCRNTSFEGENFVGPVRFLLQI